MLSFPRLVTLITFVCVLAMATRVAMDVDTWWQLQAGKWMTEQGAVLRQDVFTHTVNGTTWDYPAWLSSVVLYNIFSHWGFAGLNLFTAACVTLAFAFVWATCEAEVFLRAGVVLLATVASAVFWSARAQIISFAFCACVLYVLWLYRRRSQNRLWVLPLIFALWANVHPAYVAGLTFVALTSVGEALEASLITFRTRVLALPAATLSEKQAWQRVAWLAGIGAVCAVALLLSPYGISAYSFTFTTLSIGVLRNNIQEWQAPNFHMREAQVMIWLALATLGAVGLSRLRMAFADLLLFASTFYLALVAGRNIALFALVAAPVLARHAQAAWQDTAGRLPWLARLQRPAPPPRPINAVFNWLILLLVALAALVKMAIPLSPKINEELVYKDLPTGAVAYLQAHQPTGPMYNPYQWGGYLSWALYPTYTVYVDGRTDLYSNDFLRSYLRVTSGANSWETELAQYQVQLLLVETDSVLAELAQASGHWQVVYGDDIAQIFVPANVPAAAEAQP